MLRDVISPHRYLLDPYRGPIIEVSGVLGPCVLGHVLSMFVHRDCDRTVRSVHSHFSQNRTHHAHILLLAKEFSLPKVIIIIFRFDIEERPQLQSVLSTS